MKAKSSSPSSSSPSSSPSVSTASSSSPPQPVVAHDTSLRQRRKPHILPPLETRRTVDCRAEVGSPTPKWRVPSAEEQMILEERPTDGKPAIRLTSCPDPKTSPSVPPTTLHISSRYAPLDPIKRKDSKPA